MSKTSSVYRNLKRDKMAEKYANRRLKLKKVVMDKNASPEDRFQATLSWPLCRVTLLKSE